MFLSKSRVGWLQRVLIPALLLSGLGTLAPARGGEYLNVQVEPDRAVPSACLTFTTALARGKADALEPYVVIEPKIDHSLAVRGRDLCVTGFQHGQHYALTLKAGLPSSDGSTLSRDQAVEIQMPDRERQVSFDQGKTLLPFTKGVGLPLKSINVAKAHITLYRFNDRALVDQLANDWFGQGVSGYNLDTIADHATKMYEGSLAIASLPNRQVTTTMPIDQLIKGLTPGVYVALATPDGDKPDRYDERATQWFSVSDIGLLTVKTDAGLLVSARSLQTAKPLANVALKLIAQSNEILGAYQTDTDGRVLIPGGLMRGEHGDAAKILSAVGGRDDLGGSQFTWLQLDAAALDLSDLDIKGRAPPETNDAFLWTDRGVYRPGETIHLGALLRDARAQPVTGVPLTLHIVRPDGIEVEKRPVDLASASGGTLDFHVPDNAFSGAWRLWASAGDKKEVGTTSVSVQDFVPPRLEAKLSLPAGPIAADGAITALISADYFYGSPGADLTGQVEATLKTATNPFKGYETFSFGLVQEPFLPKALTPQDFTTDDKGRASVALQAEQVPDTTGPLDVELHASVNDVDGRAASADVSRVLHTADRFIGLEAIFKDGLADGADAAFDVVMLDGDGKPLPAQGIKWDLVKEDYVYNYFFRDGRYQSKETVLDARVSGGDVVLGPDGRGTIKARVTSGRWRVEAYDASGKTATSLRFGAGWWASGQSDNRKPEVMSVTVDAAPPAGKVRAMVEPAFAGRVLVMLSGNGLHGVRDVEMPKGGASVEFDAADVPASGAYVVAVAVSPAGAVIPRLPARAVGIAWVPGEAAAHKLDVALTAPDTVHPMTGFDVDVRVADTGGEAFVTLAAVDEAVLRMTDFATPDPADFYLGRRAPGVELRDVYGTLIDPSGQPGRLSEGGDNANVKTGGLDVKTFKTVALFQGPVKLDAQGHATLHVDVPDFSGRLRLMAVAWSGDRYGKADRPVTVRPPLLAELTLPRFLAPGDKATARLMLTDLDAPEQTYTITVKTEGAVSFDKAEALFKDVRRDKRRYVDRVLTAAAVPGVGRIHLTAKGDDGTVAERDFEIAVRTPNAYVTDRQIISLAPSQHLTVDDALGQGLVPGTGTVAVTASNTPAFDVPGLLASLRAYPYGCAEQTISRAFPELFVKGLGGAVAVPVADTATAQGAVQRLFSLQNTDGSFGYWTAFDSDDGNFWLTAYAVDFLQHARAQGLAVPDSMENHAVAWLAGRFATIGTSPKEVAGAAYAAIILARAKKLDLSQLRYVASRMSGHLPSDLARFQLAAALTHVGERDRAMSLVKAASITRDPKDYLNDYGSAIRDRAMVLSLSAEEKLASPKTLFVTAVDLARAVGGKGWLSTQEETWLLRAAFDLRADGPLRVTLDGKSPKLTETSIATSLPLGKGRASELVNTGTTPVFVSLASTGIPAGTQPAEATGFTIERSYFHLDGTPADLADVHQNDELVIVVQGTMNDAVHRKTLMVDMLPAGLEPETIGLSGDRDTGQFAWLKEVTDPTFTALRDDRFLAGLDLEGEKARFKYAYVVRAVTPGSFARPGSQIEDMYAPAYHARGAAGTLEVKLARKPKPAEPAIELKVPKTISPKR